MSELNAYLDGELCGTFMEKNGQITFAYSPGYESSVPLSLSMPERNRTHKNKVALPFLKGLFKRTSLKALVFNVGVVGTDAHAKNYSLVHRESGSELAPLYDLISAAAHIGDESLAYFPMGIKKNYRFTQISDEGLVFEGQRLGLPRQRAQELVEEILSYLPEAFEETGKEHGLEDATAKIVDGLGRLSPARFISNYWR